MFRIKGAIICSYIYKENCRNWQWLALVHTMLGASVQFASHSVIDDSLNWPILRHDFVITNKLTGTDRQTGGQMDINNHVLRQHTS